MPINPESTDRAELLASRLVAWHVSGDQTVEIFAEAHRKFALIADELFDDPLSGPADILLTVFEQTLDDYDAILRSFPTESPIVDEMIRLRDEGKE